MGHNVELRRFVLFCSNWWCAENIFMAKSDDFNSSFLIGQASRAYNRMDVHCQCTGQIIMRSANLTINRRLAVPVYGL